jgi:hypothetical protein
MRLIFHPSSEKHVAPMAVLDLVIKHSVNVQRSGGGVIFCGQQLAKRQPGGD